MSLSRSVASELTAGNGFKKNYIMRQDIVTMACDVLFGILNEKPRSHLLHYYGIRRVKTSDCRLLVHLGLKAWAESTATFHGSRTCDRGMDGWRT